jgi:hypothetical protein
LKNSLSWWPWFVKRFKARRSPLRCHGSIPERCCPGFRSSLQPKTSASLLIFPIYYNDFSLLPSSVTLQSRLHSQQSAPDINNDPHAPGVLCGRLALLVVLTARSVWLCSRPLLPSGVSFPSFVVASMRLLGVPCCMDLGAEAL